MSAKKNPVLRVLGLEELSGQGWRVHFSFWIVILMTFFLYGDQNLPSSNLSRIGADLGVPENEYLQYIGGIPTALFFVVGGIISLSMGVLTDQWDRKKLIVLTVVFGELPCLLTGFAPDYTTYLILRTLTGIGLGGIFPIVFSLIGDYFKPANRPTASAWLGLSMGLGIAVGQVLAGKLAHDTLFGLSGWRASFIIMAAPSFPIAILYMMFGRTPKRGQVDKTDAPADFVEPQHKLTMSDVKRVLGTKTNILGFAQGIFGTVPWGFLFTYTVDLYEKTKGFSVDQANLLVISFGGASLLGAFLGGFWGKLLYKTHKNWLPVVNAIAVFVGMIPTLYIVNYEGTDILPPLIAAVLGGIIAPMVAPNMRAILINTNVPENRGSVFAVYNLADDLGKGLGPFFVAALLWFLPQIVAYNVSVLFWLICGIIWLFMTKTMIPDEERTNAELGRRNN